MSATAPPKKSVVSSSGHIGHLRWWICGLLLYATTVNYVDRAVLGILEPTIARELHWTKTEYGLITLVFQIGYALMMPIAGRLIDWLGLRFGYAVATTLWSVASMSHALARSGTQFAIARLGLGIGESGNFPACIKAVADWFPKHERALATGIFNGGSTLGAIVAPLLVPFITAQFGWHAAFLFTGALSFSFVILWLLFYREPEQNPRLSPGELVYIRSEQEHGPVVSVPYKDLLDKPAAWAYLVGKVLTDPVWWFYLFWLPGFLHDRYGLDLTHIGAPLIAIYALSGVGSVGGGWLSSFWLKRGWPATKARKAAMLVCALAVSVVILVPQVGGNLWLSVLLIGIATAAHQGWSANLYTIVSDNFPRAAVASVIGFGGLGGALGGAFVQPIVGKWLDFSGNAYGPLFIVAGTSYLLALLIIHLLLQRQARLMQPRPAY